MASKQNVTIHADASWFISLQKGSYAYWVTYDSGIMKNAAMINGNVASSTEAELHSIFIAMHAVMRQRALLRTGVRQITVNTDCEACITLMLRGRSRNNRLSIMIDKIITLEAKLHTLWGCNVRYRYTIGHGELITKKARMNAWCDTTARQCLLEYKSKIKHTYITKN